jgi:predicted Zn-dependent protease
MKKILFLSLMASFFVFSCQKEQGVQDENLTDLEKKAILAKGFSPEKAIRISEGFLVEGDIVLTTEEMQETALYQFLKIAEVEQYRTNNLVTGLPRQITVSISSQLPSSYVACLDIALARYNAENLLLTFTRVTSGANISIVKGNGSYLASAGFPTSTGQPYNQVKVNSRAIGNNPNQNYLATILAHEIGHCIGMRHTDFADRSYSCGGSPTNEGASTVGAVHIPGTPTGPDPNSWMLACIGSGQNRPFNANDKVALNYLY